MRSTFAWSVFVKAAPRNMGVLINDWWQFLMTGFHGISNLNTSTIQMVRHSIRGYY